MLSKVKFAKIVQRSCFVRFGRLWNNRYYALAATKIFQIGISFGLFDKPLELARNGTMQRATWYKGTIQVDASVPRFWGWTKNCCHTVLSILLVIWPYQFIELVNSTCTSRTLHSKTCNPKNSKTRWKALPWVKNIQNRIFVSVSRVGLCWDHFSLAHHIPMCSGWISVQKMAVKLLQQKRSVNSI